MAIEYLGLSEINGPLVVLEGVQNAAYDEIVEMTVAGNLHKIGRIIEIYGDRAIIQVFEGTDGMALRNTHTRLTGHPMEIEVSEEMLGRTFNGIGQPIDGLGDIISDVKLDINGKPLNPVTREYPRNYIRTGISAIDGLTTLIRGQKLPIFSGNGLPHDQLAARLCSRHPWERIRMRSLPLCSAPWVSNTMWLISSAVPLRRAAYPSMWPCSSTWPTTLWWRAYHA